MMSQVSKSKSKDKKAGKEQTPKSSPKPSVHVNTSTGAPASGYNPLSGTFHTFESAPVPTSSLLHSNTRFHNIDDSDDHSNADYDSGSNNGSWSGESEDHKEKAPPQPTVPGADNDKREKIRLKNERKHQRQKERRAQELHERCSGYLMSWKLEALSQQFVSMGFSRERSTMALILNEGRVEESVTWLFEGGEEDKLTEHSNNNSSSNLKIDISEELARITEMEIRYRASKQEVERVLVSCEGNIDRAEEILKAQKEEPPAVVEPSKPQEISGPSKQPVQIYQNPTRIQTKLNVVQQQKRDERDFNYTKPQLIDTGVKNIQMLKKAFAPTIKPEWTKPQQIIIASASVGSNPSETEKREPPKYVNELKNLQLGSVKEPVIVMQRPQPIITPKQTSRTSIGSSPPGPNMGWYSNPVETMKPNGHVPSFAVNSNPLYNQFHYQSQQQQQQQQPQYVSSNRMPSPALGPASSLGLYSGIGTNGSGSLDWKMGGSILQCDYANVDWSLDPSALPPRPRWAVETVDLNSAHGYDSFAMRAPVLSNLTGVVVRGLSEGVDSKDPGMVVSREWTSPFEEKDIFSLPRRFVSSPTL